MMLILFYQKVGPNRDPVFLILFDYCCFKIKQVVLNVPPPKRGHAFYFLILQIEFKQLELPEWKMTWRAL